MPTLEEILASNAIAVDPSDLARRQLGAVQPGALRDALSQGPVRPYDYNPPAGQWNQRDFEAARAGVVPLPFTGESRRLNPYDPSAQLSDLQPGDMAQVARMREEAQQAKEAANLAATGYKDIPSVEDLARKIGGYGYTRNPTSDEMVRAINLQQAMIEPRKQRESAERIAMMHVSGGAAKQDEIEANRLATVEYNRARAAGMSEQDALRAAENSRVAYKKLADQNRQAQTPAPTPEPTPAPPSTSGPSPALAPAPAAGPSTAKRPEEFLPPNFDPYVSNTLLTKSAPKGVIQPHVLADELKALTESGRFAPRYMPQLAADLSGKLGGAEPAMQALEEYIAEAMPLSRTDQGKPILGAQAVGPISFRHEYTPTAKNPRTPSVFTGTVFERPGGVIAGHPASPVRSTLSDVFRTKAEQDQYTDRAKVLAPLLQALYQGRQ